MPSVVPGSPRSTRIPPLVLLFAAAPIVFYYLALYHLCVSAPLLDDYSTTLDFLTEQAGIHGFLPRLFSAVTSQQGEYRSIFVHTLMSADFSLFGRMSFRLIILIGDLFLLPVFWAFWQNTFPEAPRARRLVLFLPVLFLLCQLSYSEMLDFAEAGLQYWILPFAFLALHFLTRPANHARTAVHLTLACLFGALACTASPNGFLLGPIGIVLLWPSVRRMAVWSLTFAAVLAAYLYKYVPQLIRRPPGPFTRPLFFFSFLGGALENMHHRPIPYSAIALGLVLFAAFVQSVRTRYWRSHPFWFWSAAWTLATSALVAYVRSGLGLQQSLSSRYKIYCALMLVFTYLYGVTRTASLGPTLRKRIYLASLAASILFCLSADALGYKFLARRHDHTLNAFAWYRADPARNSPYINFYIDGRDNDDASRERQSLNRAISAGVYTVPPLPPPPPGSDH